MQSDSTWFYISGDGKDGAVALDRAGNRVLFKAPRGFEVPEGLVQRAVEEAAKTASRYMGLVLERGQRVLWDADVYVGRDGVRVEALSFQRHDWDGLVVERVRIRFDGGMVGEVEAKYRPLFVDELLLHEFWEEVWDVLSGLRTERGLSVRVERDGMMEWLSISRTGNDAVERIGAIRGLVKTVFLGVLKRLIARHMVGGEALVDRLVDLLSSKNPLHVEASLVVVSMLHHLDSGLLKAVKALLLALGVDDSVARMALENPDAYLFTEVASGRLLVYGGRFIVGGVDLAKLLGASVAGRIPAQAYRRLKMIQELRSGRVSVQL